jgi:hypothetical protein
MMSHFNNPQWAAWPWRYWKAPFEQAKVLPTFLVNEWTYRAVTATCAWHAAKTGNWQLWFSSWICGTFNDAFFMAMPFCDNFWQAQACIMVTPRMPLYIIEMYAAILYCSTTGARRFGLPYAPEAALCGLLAHLMYHPYDINGPRFLWWTWHDADPAISKRHRNAPYGSSIWILTYCALHAALNRWVNDRAAPSFKELAKQIIGLTEGFIKQVVGAWASKGFRLAEFMAERVDLLHSKLVDAPSLAKIVFCGSVCTPMFMTAMGQLQIFSLDVIGIPGKRTYRLAILLYTALLARAIRLGHSAGPTKVPKHIQEANLVLFRALAVFYTVQSAVAVLGRPEQHVSTGCHQKIGRPGDKIIKDIMGYDREEHVAESVGPRIYSKDDYVFPEHGSDGNYDASGHKIVRGKADDSVSCEWYTVLGKTVPFKQRAEEIMGVLAFSTIGSLLYGWALSGPVN